MAIIIYCKLEFKATLLLAACRSAVLWGAFKKGVYIFWRGMSSTRRTGSTKSTPLAPGVFFKGGRSTGVVKTVLADALRAVAPEAAANIENERNWRANYYKHIAATCEHSLRSSKASLDIARRGLAALANNFGHRDCTGQVYEMSGAPAAGMGLLPLNPLCLLSSKTYLHITIKMLMYSFVVAIFYIYNSRNWQTEWVPLPSRREYNRH